MIDSINKIKGYGIYNNYLSSIPVLQLKKYNLVYGWNATGKSTLAKLLKEISLGAVDSSSEFSLTIDSVEINNANYIDHKPLARVFDDEFVKSNIRWDECSTNLIFYIGKDSIDLQEELKIKEDLLISLDSKIKHNKLESESLSIQVDKLLINKSKDIKELLRNENKDIFQNYNKSHLKDTIIAISTELDTNQSAHYLTENDFKIAKEMTNQHVKPKLANIPDLNLLTVKDYDEMLNICNETVISKTINDLMEDNVLNLWVKEGLFLHKGKTICQFCGNTIDQTRLNELEGHFSDSYIDITNRIDLNLIKLQLYINENLQSRYSELYSDLQGDYLTAYTDLSTHYQGYLNIINELKGLLETKKSNVFSSPNFTPGKYDDPKIEQLRSDLKKCNLIVDKHNTKSDNFTAEIIGYKAKIEKHIVNRLYPDYKKLVTRQSSLNHEIEESEPTFQSLTDRIQEIKIKISDSKLAMDTFNKHLQSFLGRDDIRLVPKDDVSYTINRNNGLAQRLSEGERSAIAFIYFILTLSDKDTRIEDTIIVIDDPVSSLDSNYLYHAFSYMVDNIDNAQQILIFTHNYKFLNMVKMWMKRQKKVDPQKIKEAEKNYQFLMIKNHIVDGARNASIAPMDRLLADYESEYQFLFKLLHQFANSSDTELDECYFYPNIARRYLETFLNFRIPNNKDLYSKMEKLIKDSEKRMRLYRFVNDFSHDRKADALTDFDTSCLENSKKIIKELLDEVRKIDTEHFNGLTNIASI